ncbi:hypothetical protein FRD01_04710 [Microvenator marinus]|jgi:uncharacterized membrane protein|uniref:Uncharacterized protein n=1 Tax=Microvenator marinus TaxID=2600177 RepID=A0A5B8XNG1_9DELT|nr:hypothetical protein FRD01_04710 [Microvenator marinus]
MTLIVSFPLRETSESNRADAAIYDTIIVSKNARLAAKAFGALLLIATCTACVFKAHLVAGTTYALITFSGFNACLDDRQEPQQK